MTLNALTPGDRLKSLYSSAYARLRNVNITYRIGGEMMSVSEVTDLVAGAAKYRERLTTLVIENVYLLPSAIRHIEISLLRIGRKGY